MAFPLTYHRITNSDFRLCSTRRSRSQASLYVYTHCMVSIHAEPTFERLRYILGGDRPSQTAHLTMSRSVLQRYRLESQQSKSGIPKLTPHMPKHMLLRLPPILCINCRDSISSYSKALRGLSVQSRVNTHLHVYYNFAGPPVETAPKSLRHSCGSELTRQGISLP